MASFYDPRSWDPPGDWNSLRSNPLSNLVFGKTAQQQPGVGGPAQDPHRLVQDPQTGMFFDPATGTSYTDASGQTPITNPNIAQQVATNVQRSNAFIGQLGGLEQQRQDVYGQQSGLADAFRNVISGQAPSVAAMQAQAQAAESARQQLAQVAGTSGASSPLASLMAARNTGQVQIGANNAGAIARVGEQKAAMDALNALLNSQGQGVENAAGRVTGAGVDFSRLAGDEEKAQQGLNQDSDKKRAEEESKFGWSAVKIGASAANPAAGAIASKGG